MGCRGFALLAVAACRIGFDAVAPDDASLDAPADAIVCEGGTQRVVSMGHCYVLYVVAANITWDEARIACEAEGTHLVTYSSIAEEAPVTSMLAAETRAWIGMNDLAVEATWTWITGEPFSYMNWRGVEPNNAGAGEHCGAHSVAATSWQWNDLECDGGTNGVLEYICEHGD